ncbi:MAG: TetR/AcrR family transcriptional regulator C-terminal domain-containing protein [Blautia sp.]|nr:TetR/AcrR family transcriptional regulator C-terminal domain-containing protein [Blautia sp.]
MKSERTKQLLAETLKESLSRMPLEKVRVDALCKECGLDRRTFYYHFKDKYDLVAWIFLQDYEGALKEENGMPTLEMVERVLRKMHTQRAFYRKVFSDKSQNAISQYIYDLYVQMFKEKVLSFLGKEELSHKEMYTIKSYVFACVGHTKEWFEGITDYSPEEFAFLQRNEMPPILRRAYHLEEEKPDKKE